jgi:flagellar basal-body rod modification protein FlgD
VELTNVLAAPEENPSGISPSGTRSAASLASQDFYELLVTQLTNQDPLEPMGNEELLRQIASIREIELSSSLTESLQSLADQQQFGSASSLIGQYVTGLPGADGVVDSGLVIGIRFTDGGRPVLQLANGIEMPLEQVSMIESPLTFAQTLVGRQVVGVDRRDPSEPSLVEGVVTGVTVADTGEVTVELDTGQDLRLSDLIGPSAQSS